MSMRMSPPRRIAALVVTGPVGNAVALLLDLGALALAQLRMRLSRRAHGAEG